MISTKIPGWFFLTWEVLCVSCYRKGSLQVDSAQLSHCYLDCFFHREMSLWVIIPILFWEVKIPVSDGVKLLLVTIFSLFYTYQLPHKPVSRWVDPHPRKIFQERALPPSSPSSLLQWPLLLQCPLSPLCRTVTSVQKSHGWPVLPPFLKS